MPCTAAIATGYRDGCTASRAMPAILLICCKIHLLCVITRGHANDIRKPHPFLATIASRLVTQRWHRNLLETAYLEALATLPVEPAPSPEAHVPALETLLEIDRALDGLPIRLKEAFLLAHLEKFSYTQIAERLNVSTHSVKQYLIRANRQCLFALTI